MEEGEKPEFKNFYDVLKEGKKLLESGDKRYIESIIDNEKMTTILFTSGTTSMSKAVMLSQKNIMANIYGINCAEKVYSTDINMAFLPFHHIFASTGLLTFLSNGTTTVFCDGLKYIAQNLKEYKVTIFMAVPLILESMYKKIMAEVDKKGKTKLIKIMTKVCNFLLFFKIDIRRKIFKEIIESLGGARFIVSGAAAIDKKVAKAFNDFRNTYCSRIWFNRNITSTSCRK